MTKAKQSPMMCPTCGIPMNHHAEKLVDPRDAAEAKRVDPGLGGMVEEFHACGGCGRVDSRPA